MKRVLNWLVWHLRYHGCAKPPGMPFEAFVEAWQREEKKARERRP